MFVSFSIENFILWCQINWPNFINRLCLTKSSSPAGRTRRRLGNTSTVITCAFRHSTKSSSYSIKCFSCFMLRHLMTSWHLHISNVKFDYLKNEKSFRNQIKTFFLVSQVLSFRHTKQTSKNEAEATFKFLQVVLRVCCFRTNSSVSKDVMWIQPFRLGFLFGSDTWRKKSKLVVNKSILLKVLWKFLWNFLKTSVKKLNHL